MPFDDHLDHAQVAYGVVRVRCAHDLLGSIHCVQEPIVLRDHELDARFTRRPGHLGRLLDRTRDRFLHQHVLPVTGGLPDVVQVEVVRSEVIQRFDLGVGRGFFVVAEIPCSSVVLAISASFVDIAARKIKIEFVLHVVDVVEDDPGVPATPDDADR